MSYFSINIQDQIVEKLWEVEDYRDFIKIIIDENWVSSIKSKSDLGRALELTPTFISKVFSKQSHLSLEHVEQLSRIIELKEVESIALIDKALYAKSTSIELKSLIEKRLKKTFDSKGTPRLPDLKTPVGKSNVESNTGVNFWKIRSALINSCELTVEEIASRTKMTVVRTQFLIDKMLASEQITRVKALEGYKYHRKAIPTGSQSLQKQSSDLFNLSSTVRKMAQLSLELRHPIDIVDTEEHYNSGSFILSLNDEDIESIKFYLTSFSEKIGRPSTEKNKKTDKKLVGLCFDFFDLV